MLWIALPFHDPCCQMQKVHVIPIMFRREISRSKRYPARAVESPPRRPAKQARSSSTGQVGEAFCFQKKDVTATDHSDAQDDLLEI